MSPSPEFSVFVASHLGDDPSKLRLRYRGDLREWVPEAIGHIESLQKVRKSHKFVLASSGDFTPEYMPLPLAVEQASSAAICRLHAQLTGENLTSILDMTCGLGMDARFMAEAHPQAHITAIELNPLLAEAARWNYRELTNLQILGADSVKWLEEYSGEPFSLVFIDPARRGAEGQRVYALADCQPSLPSLLPTLREKARKVMAKLSPMLDLTQTLRELPDTTQLCVVEEGGECRELLAIIDFVRPCLEPSEEPLIRVITPNSEFSFRQSEEAEAVPRFDTPCPGQFLLEPGAAAMKAGAFKLMATRFDACKLHPFTHLYVSPTAPADFPGNVYKILDVRPLKEAKRLGRDIGRADVAVRNLPGLTAEGLRRRMGLKSSGGSLRVMGSTTHGGDHVLLLLEKPEKQG